MTGKKSADTQGVCR